MQVTVVGAGIVGLTTALVLEEHGHDVRVVAAERGNATTSAVAGAVYFPYRCGPRDKVLAWGEVTLRWFQQYLYQERDTGVDWLTGYEITNAPAWWGAGLDVKRALVPVTDRPQGWRYTAMRIEPAMLLSWISRQLRARVEQRRVVDLESEPGDIVVNCTGLGARALANDDTVGALFGQIVICEPGNVDLSIVITDDRDPEKIFYVIPRREEVVLGGCAIAWPHDKPAVVDPAITERILAHARALGLSVGDVKTVRAGLRPYRENVRVERVGRVIHNYGHGGAGYTLCRGCADDVVKLVAG